MIAADMLQLHSGGKVSEALRMSISMSTLPISSKTMNVDNNNKSPINLSSYNLGINQQPLANSCEKLVNDETMMKVTF
jgi:hypothetical protein